MALSSPGVGSGLDVKSIVSQLMAIERRPLVALDTKEARFQAKLSAYGSIKGAIAGFQTAVSGLRDASKFQALTATSSDSSVLSASSTSIAVAGTYSLEVSKLAQAQKLVATGKADSTSVIGNGTLTFDFGTIDIVGPPSGSFDSTTGKYTDATFISNGGGTKTVTIDATNNSMQGIRDAINAANIGVTASIINDGGTTPYRLALSPNSIGKANSMKISVAESGAAGLAAFVAHDPTATQNLSETVSAQNAEFKVNGVAVSKASNSISDVISGVTLNLLKAPTTTPVTVTIARNTTAIQSSIQGFVKAYNEVNKTLGDLSAYDPTTKTGAVLQGDATVRTLQSQMRAMLNTPIDNTGSTLTNLSQIGVSFQRDGTMALDNAKLNTVMNSNASDIANLFAVVGRASDSLVSYISAASSTKPGAYALNVSQLGTQGKLVGSAALGSLTITQNSNDALTVTVDGVSASVTLAPAVYASADALAAEVQSKINGSSALSSAGSSVAVTQSGGVFTITSNKYGSASKVLVSGTGASNLLGGTPAATTGVNAAGSFNEVEATGEGQFLTDASGLKIQVYGGSLGARGTVNYSQGYAYRMYQYATDLLASDGPLAGRTNGINSSITDIGKQRSTLNLRLADIEKRYQAQFSALDVMISNMNQTSSYLTQQLNAISNLSKE